MTRAKHKGRRPHQIFVDTGAWVAVAVEDDAHHEEATRVYPDLLRRYRLITTNLVVAETYVLLRRAAGHAPAISFLELIGSSPRIGRLLSTTELEAEAVKILKRFHDQEFSFTDAVSFAVMQQERVKEAFALDTHFRTMGFLIVP